MLDMFPALILRGGFGAAKTITGIAWIVDRLLRSPPHVKAVVVEPTWKQVRKVLVPRFQKWLPRMGLSFTHNKSEHTITLSTGHTIWMESGERPENLSGFDVGCAWIDEPELMDAEIDNRISSRVRDPDAVIRQVLYTGTPEGMTWIDDKVSTTPTLVVPTTANTHNPPDYIKRLEDRFKNDPVRMDMYVRGIARSLSGSIYTCFDPSKHLRTCSNPSAGELAIAMDFNVGFMCTPIARVIGDEIHVFDEVISRNTTTEEHVARVRKHLETKGLATFRRGAFDQAGMYSRSGSRVDAWLDATSTAHKTSSTTTDHNIVRDAGFWPRHSKSNPAVKDRIEAVQYGFSHDLTFIDPNGAPFTARAVQRHEYERGSKPPQPRKKWGVDEDPLDAATDPLGYLRFGRNPLRTQSRIAA